MLKISSLICYYIMKYSKFLFGFSLFSNIFVLNKLIPILKKQSPRLGKVASQSLQGMTKQVESAFTKFFREKMFFLNSNQRKIQFSHFQYHNTTMWILKTILLSFLRFEKSKYFFTKHLNRNYKSLVFRSLVQERTVSAF